MRPATLDGNWDRPFRATPYSLRFELGGEDLSNIGQPVPRFIQAFHRAQTVSNAMFARSSPLTAVLAASPASEHDVFAPAADAFTALANLGFRAASPWCEWSASLDPADEDSPTFNWRAIDLNEPMMRDTLLWTSIVYEMAIAPNAPVMSWLIDFEVGVMLHVYDDRGMDVCALHRAAIEPLYRQFDSWLLDYDRPRMEAVFGPR